MSKKYWDEKMAKIKCWQEEVKLAGMILGTIVSSYLLLVKLFKPESKLDISSIAASGGGLGSVGGGLAVASESLARFKMVEPIHRSADLFTIGLVCVVIIFLIFSIIYFIKVFKKRAIRSLS